MIFGQCTQKNSIKMRVIFLPEIRDYFRELAQILFDKDYFGFEESALRYVDNLFDNIEQTLPVRLKKPAPAYFDRYAKGLFYAVFKSNKNTQWYVFFNIYHHNGETIYLVRYISNNHVIAQYL
jgi:hypothetical protein